MLQLIVELRLADLASAADLDIENKNARIYSNLCRIQANTLETDEAIKHCNIVLTIEAASPIELSQAHSILGDLFQKVGDSERAKKHLFEAETIFPNDTNVKVALAKFYRAQEEFSLAVEYASQAIALNQTKTVAYSQRAYALYRLGEYDAAISDVEKGLAVLEKDQSLLPTYRPAEKRSLYYTLANIYHVTGNNEKAGESKRLGDEAFPDSYLIENN